VKPIQFLVLALPLLLCACTDSPKARMIGGAAPDFTVKDSDKTVSLHDYKGKVVVLNFWTTWCAPCIEEMPSLAQLQRKMGPNVVVLAVSTDKSDSEYHQFLLRHKIDFLTVRDESAETASLYGTTGQPETFIIDKNFRIRRKLIGPQHWDNNEFVDYINKL
jgi:cytochrome c biogenesis protein CcmG, thiol:disulfide interchange protein DsbE